MGCCGNSAKGAIGLAKAAAGMDAAADDVVQARRDICRGCDLATRNKARADRPTLGLTMLSQCKECSCFIGAKTLIASEKCPLGKW